MINDIKIGEYSNDIDVNQLKYVFLYLKYVGGLADCDYRLTLLHNNIPKYESSRLHLDCAKHLKLIGIEFNSEIYINGISIDIYIESVKIIIEVNGSSHYGYQSHKILGHTYLKNKLVKAMGYYIINIPYWEWDELTTDKEKQTYLNKLIY